MDASVEGNLFENHWKDAQAGYAIVFTPRNSGGSCTWCGVEDVRFERHGERGGLRARKRTERQQKAGCRQESSRCRHGLGV